MTTHARKNVSVMAAVISAVGFATNLAFALPFPTYVADRLVSEQAPNGSWSGEEGYTGSIIPGLANAYRLTGNLSYKATAEDGGTYILNSAGGNFYGDEAFALAELSKVNADPGSNPWRTAVGNFYKAVRSAPGGTSAYINSFASIDPSTAVFYLAHHTAAAYYVNATDRNIWRERTIDFLGTVDDSTSNYPVLALGAALWGLGSTGPLEGRLIDPDAPRDSIWYEKYLADLPMMTLRQQVPDGNPRADSFYYRFDHTDEGGYTEDTAFGILGLVAATRAIPGLNVDWAIISAQETLFDTIDSNPLSASYGRVYEYMGPGGATYATYAGELLHALQPKPGDTDGDGDVDLIDLGHLATHYETTEGAIWAHGDFDGDGDVDLVDLGTLAGNYGYGVPAPLNFVADAASYDLVPEPTTLLCLLAAGVFGLLPRRRRA